MSTVDERRAWLRRWLGPEIPRLWCPPITHYTAGGALDTERQAAHWAVMHEFVGGFLVPGSTGDGWEMDEDEIAALLDAALDLAAQLDTRILVGVLRTDVDAMLAVIERTLATLQARAGLDDPLAALLAARVGGFTICPPRGAELTQAQIGAGLEAVLELGLPLAIYQLPQVTQNEMSPALVADLAARYPNFLLFKDTSGTDRVPQAEGGASGVFLVRGAEGHYARWLRELGGPYHGLLLSTANSFPAQLGEMIALLEASAAGEGVDAEPTSATRAVALSERLTRAVEAAFALVADLPHGNAFANANKAIDHWMAHGPAAPRIAPPVLHAGVRLPAHVITATGKILEEAHLLPRHGYFTATCAG